jgi:hypothetical protein
MRSKLWPPTVASSSEPARVRIPAGACDFPRARQQHAPNVGTQTLRESGHGYPGGGRCLRASLFAQRWSYHSGPGFRESGAILLGAAGGQSLVRFEKTYSEEARSWLPLGDLTPADLSAGGTGLLPFLRARAFATSFKTSFPTGLSLSRSSHCTGCRARSLAGFIGLRSAYLGPSTRFL